MISVIMSVYNETIRWVRESAESILSQTYSDFEFIIVVDNPQIDDEIAEYLIGLEADARVKLLWNERNLGLPQSLNKGICAASGEFIARMDADDISAPDRLQRELFFLIDNNYDMVSTNKVNIDEEGAILYEDSRLGEKAIKGLLYSNVIVHSSVLIKKDAVKALGGYRKVKDAEDFDLWLRLLDAGYSIGILDEYLVKYRLRATSVSVERQLEQFYASQYARILSKERKTIGEDSFSEKEMVSFFEKKRITESVYRRFSKAKNYLETASQQKTKQQYLRMCVNTLRSGVLFPQLLWVYICKNVVVK